MKKVEKNISSEELASYIVKGMQEKKGKDIVLLDLRGLPNAITDFFVICTGNSDTQVDAIKDSIEEVIHIATDQNPWQKEGNAGKEWILIDYIDVVAHVFKKDKREFYGLEALWGDAKITRFENIG